MNNYELFNFENVNNNGINILKPMNEYKKNINYLYDGLNNAKPIYEVPDKLYRDEFMEQDIEIDISSNKFREVWGQYKDLYDEKNKVEEIKPRVIEENISLDNEINYEDNLEGFYAKAKELDNYLIELKEERKELNEKKRIIRINSKRIRTRKRNVKYRKRKI